MRRIDNTDSGAFLEYEPVPDTVGMVVICPGGGYRLVSPREGAPIAKAFARAGWQPFVLDYTVDGEALGTLPLRELSWAVNAAKTEAEGMGLAGMPLVVCGFSAGGHLAASLGVHWDDAELFPDAAARRRHRPDAMILGYPVITDGQYRHPASFARLTGEGGDTSFFSLEKHVSAATPPCFLWHTADDATVPVQNTFRFAEALVRSRVPVEIHIYPFGVHGLSLATGEVEQPEEGRTPDPHVAGWFGQAVEWLDVVFRKERQ